MVKNLLNIETSSLDEKFYDKGIQVNYIKIDIARKNKY